MNVRYLVVGGGMAADAAVKSLRKADPAGSVLLVSAEADAPYKRPPLSKGLWQNGDESKVQLGTAASGAQLLLSREVVSLDADAGSATLDDGTVVRYQYALLATGARARNLPFLAPLQNAIPYRTYRDYQRVLQLLQPGARVVVVGGGFIGSEMAAALSTRGAHVGMIFPEQHIGGGRFPATLAARIDADYQQRGVQLFRGSGVQSARSEGTQVVLELADGTELPADLVLVGVGTQPNDELASGAGFLTDNGVVVDAGLRAMKPGGEVGNVFAAGDVASFEWPGLGRRMRIEHEDNAYSMGAAAGRFMAAQALAGGAPPSADARVTYNHLPFFYSDLFDNGYEAVGLLDPRMDVVEDWRNGGKEGVVYFLEDGLVRGVLLWNTWGQVDAARDLILSSKRHAPEELMGRLPTDD